MNYKIEHLEKRYFIGIPLKTSYENGRFQKEVPELWDKLYRENLTEKVSNKVNDELLAVYTDYEGDYTKPFTYMLGFEVSSLDAIPEQMRGIEIAASSYVILTAQGGFPLSNMQKWQAIWNSNVKRAYTTDFEVYKPLYKLPSTAYYNPQIQVFIALEESV